MPLVELVVMGVDALDFSGGSEELNLNLDGWEGPLDLLLNLARGQKVDLAQISILQLVDQYTDYIANARALKLEIAADYLVMAAWLAYLKSCLLLPKDPEQDPSPEEVALRLQMRLAAARRDARGRRSAARPRSRRPGRLRARRTGRPSPRPQVGLAGQLLRTLFGLWHGQGANRSPPCMSCTRASVMTLDDAIERVEQDDRDGHRLDGDRPFPA